MRLLWDLYDPSNEPYDQLEYGVNQIYRICRDNTIDKVSSLWGVLREEICTGASYRTRIDTLADVFVEAGVGVRALQASIGGPWRLDLTWNL